MATKTIANFPTIVDRKNGINWDSLGFATAADRDRALEIILSGKNTVHGDARAHNEGAKATLDGLFWLKSHYYNTNHPTFC